MITLTCKVCNKTVDFDFDMPALIKFAKQTDFACSNFCLSKIDPTVVPSPGYDFCEGCGEEVDGITYCACNRD